MKTLRGQLTLRLVIVGALLLGAAGIALHWQVKRALGAEFDNGLAATLQTLTILTEQQHDGKIMIEVTGENARQFEDEHGADVFLLRAVKGVEIQRSISLGSMSLPFIAGPQGQPAFSESKLDDGRTLRLAGVSFFPLIEDEERPSVTKVTLVVGRDLAPMDRSLAMLRVALFITGASAIALLAAAVAWGVNSGLAPVRGLRDDVCKVDASSLGTRFEAGPLPEELRPVAASLNELLARLQSAFERERRFTATAAHELRTPLAELRALAEVNLKTPATEAERTESWQDVLATTRRMESLALHLLELTRAENPARVIRSEPVTLGDAIGQSWKSFATRAGERGIAMEVSVPPDLAARSDRALLGIVLGNLCGNAAEHAMAGTPFRISATQEAGAVTLHFCNRTGDLNEQDAAHLFERFWRKDAARTDGRHHGLGLALAREFAVLIGGELTAQFHAVRDGRVASDASGGEIEFTLRLPLNA